MSRMFRRGILATVVATVLALPLSAGAAQAAPQSPAAVTAQGGSPANTFVPVPAMSVRRSGATATLLGDGDVLVAGGGTAAASLFDPDTRTWSATASMSTVRSDATATLLADGDVLVAGGCCEVGQQYENLATAELYDPSTGTWTNTGSLNVARSGDTATLLQNGDVLVAGGACNGSAYGCDAGSFLSNLKSAELYDPTTGIWTLTGSMSAGREFQTATLLANGEVLVAGGFSTCDDDFCTDLKTAELYDPVTGKWLPTGSMATAREQHTATMLTDGDVLVAGGLNQGGSSGHSTTFASAELYDPLSGRWSPAASMNQARAGHTATLLSGGWVLVTGGGTDTSEVYEPDPGVWVPTGDLSTSRTDQTATALGNGDVLVAGGTGPDQESLATAEEYLTGVGPLVDLSTTALSLPTQEVGTSGNALSFTVTNYGTGALDVAGVEVSGSNPSDFTARSGCQAGPVAPGASCAVVVRFVPLYPGLRTAMVTVFDNAPLDPQAVGVSGYAAGPYVWVPTGSMGTPRENFSSTLLANGQVLVAGGEESVDQTDSTSELYDPATGSFSPTGSLITSRESQASALLPDGDVLVAGGYTATDYIADVLSSAEIYDPATGIWTPTGSMLVAGNGLKATALPNGLVLVTGFDGSSPELFDPTTGTWSDSGPLPVAGLYGLAVLLHTGEVLLTGGPDGASALYEPTTNSWSATGPLDGTRFGSTATVLADGDVLVAGGLPGSGGSALSTAELYNPAKGTWSATSSMPAGRYDQSAVLLPNGSVLVAGGCDLICENGPTQQASYIYSQGFWSTTGSLAESRLGQSATVLRNGQVLLAGGDENYSGNATPTAELYSTPLISASPTHAAVGQNVTLSGSGFYAHETVSVTLNGPAERFVASPVADNRGSFTVNVKVPAIPVGTYSLNAEGMTSFVSADSTFVVS
jgi:N-acetylneuraminic acid mutarotase